MYLKIFIAIIIIALIGGGSYFFMQSRSTTPSAENEEVTPTQEFEPTPTPEEAERDAFDIEILNGSGIAGEAGRAQELLEGDDFVVISTGNADTYDYEETVIQASSDVPDEWIDQLIDTLEENYTVQTRVDDIDGATDADVVVIIGQLDDNGDTMVVEEEEDTTEDTEDEEETTEEEPTETPSPTPEE